MPSPQSRLLAALFGAAVVLSVSSVAMAQSASDAKGQEQKPPAGQPAEPGKDDKRRSDEFAEAARVLGPGAGHPECVWLGRRAVSLLWRDDLDTAFRHLELYERFRCPGGHIQATFRCVVRQGSIDPKAPESLNARVHACWINPELQPAAAQAPNGPAGAPASAPAAAAQPAEKK